MATHHGRPGGRLVEVVLALGLVVLSAVLLLAGLAFVVVVATTVAAAAFSFSPGVGAALMAGSGGLMLKFGRPVMRAIWTGLVALWRPFLAYYRYEAHSLRPIENETTAMPIDGREKNEG